MDTDCATDLKTVKYYMKHGDAINDDGVCFNLFINKVSNNNFQRNLARKCINDGQKKSLEYLLSHGCPISGLLHCAVIATNLDIISLLIDNGANLNEIVSQVTPLILAVQMNSFDIVKYLLEKGSDPSCTGNGKIPLYFAAENGNLDICNLLIQYKSPLTGMASSPSPTYIALINGHENIVTRLLFLGANPNSYIDEKEGKKTLLEISIESKSDDVLKSLLTCCVDLKQMNESKLNPSLKQILKKFIADPDDSKDRNVLDSINSIILERKNVKKQVKKILQEMTNQTQLTPIINQIRSTYLTFSKLFEKVQKAFISIQKNRTTIIGQQLEAAISSEQDLVLSHFQKDQAEWQNIYQQTLEILENKKESRERFIQNVKHKLNRMKPLSISNQSGSCISYEQMISNRSRLMYLNSLSDQMNSIVSQISNDFSTFSEAVLTNMALWIEKYEKPLKDSELIQSSESLLVRSGLCKEVVGAVKASACSKIQLLEGTVKQLKDQSCLFKEAQNRLMCALRYCVV